MTIIEMTPDRADFLRQRFDAMDDILSVPEQWTRGFGARNAYGKVVNPADPQAVCWCLLGAAYKSARQVAGGAAARETHNEMMLCLRTALGEMGHAGITIGEYNDDFEFPAIKDLITRARATLPPGSDAGTGTETAA